MRRPPVFLQLIFPLFLLNCAGPQYLPQVPANTWTQVARDDQGARRMCSFRWVEEGGYFLLWGYHGFISEYYGNPEIPYDENKEYDIVAFDPRLGNWQSQFPLEKQEEWSRELPPMHECNSYQGITTGSSRPQLKEREGVLRPDLNITFDQLSYDPPRKRMLYFTGGRTFAYDVVSRVWSDAAPGGNSPPPVLGGSLCYDPINDRIILSFGGKVAEPGPDGRPVGYTGTWAYDCTSSSWSRLETSELPPPRMATRLVYDPANEVMVAFGGDGQSRYLADTWIFDVKNDSWRESKAADGPPARAGHFTVYDPSTGWVIIGGGYGNNDLTDMWAFDAGEERWLKLKGEVPTGFHVTADIVPDKSLIVLTTSAKKPDDDMGCNEIYMVRTTWAFRIDPANLVDESVQPGPQQPLLKRSLEEATTGSEPDPARRQQQLERIISLPVNQWAVLDHPGRDIPIRTWGSCSFDTRRGRIIYWGGGHCGYGGNDYEFYDVEDNTWISSPKVSEFPERAWDKGINPAGVTFSGAPWIRHGRKVYAYDPVSGLVINTKFVPLTAGYDPEPLKVVEPLNPDFGSGEDFIRSTYTKWTTWTFDPDTEKWEMLCSGKPGLDLTVTTPYGVMAVDHNWGAVNSKDRPDLTVFEGDTVVDNSVYLLSVAERSWKKLTHAGPWPQNLYEMTALVYDSRRDCLYLHGGGRERSELWKFDLKTGLWKNLDPGGVAAPECRREAVYIPGQDVLLTFSWPAGHGDDPGVYAYRPAENRWYRAEIPPPPGRELRDIVQQNRAATYDPKHDLVLMVLGERGGDLEQAVVYALRYDHRRAKLVGR